MENCPLPKSSPCISFGLRYILIRKELCIVFKDIRDEFFCIKVNLCGQ